MAEIEQSLAVLLALPGVADAIESAREACTRLRWHEALRRRTPEAAAESRVRGAQASGALEGVDLPVDRVRDLVRGAVPWPQPPDAGLLVLRGAVRATAETERVRAVVLPAPLQAMARLHVAAMSGVLPAGQVGRPRAAGETSLELVDLGPAPPPAAVSGRLAVLSSVLARPGAAPALLVGAILHGEIASIRPFVRGNGVVARAMERAFVQASGLDPTGVAVPEGGHRAGGGPAYLGALTAYATGSGPGVALWLTHCAAAMVAAAAEGARVADAVLAGRLR